MGRRRKEPYRKSGPSVERLLAALMTQGQGIQKLHVAVGNQIKRLQCEEQCLLDMLQSANAAVACAPGDALGPGTARDDRAGDAGAALAMDNDVIVRQQTGGLVSSACEGPEQAGAAPASAAVLPGAGSPVCSAADAGAAAIGGHSSVPVAGDGVGAGHADAVGLTGAALPGTHDGYAGEYDRGPGRGEREGKGNAA